MTDLEAFKAMLERAGHEYTVEQPAVHRFVVDPGDGTRYSDWPIAYINCGSCVEAGGHFYDELSAYFDDDGGLIEMVSHVSIGHGSKRTLELWKKQGKNGRRK